jgi:hypothetical protein
LSLDFRLEIKDCANALRYRRGKAGTAKDVCTPSGWNNLRKMLPGVKKHVSELSLSTSTGESLEELAWSLKLKASLATF